MSSSDTPAAASPTPPGPPPPRRRTWRGRTARVLVAVLAVIGAITVVALTVGVVVGVSTADRTDGGYEYPYEGWTGTPTDYGSWYGTDEGLFWPGPIVDQALDCTSGQLTLQVFGLVDVEFRPLSDRAKVVHQPQVACRDRGFDTSEWDAIDDPDGRYPDL